MQPVKLYVVRFGAVLYYMRQVKEHIALLAIKVVCTLFHRQFAAFYHKQLVVGHYATCVYVVLVAGVVADIDEVYGFGYVKDVVFVGLHSRSFANGTKNITFIHHILPFGIYFVNPIAL